MEHLLLLIFPAAMVLAAVLDIGTLTIPNRLTGALALAFVPAALFMGMGWGELGLHLAVGAGVLLIGIALFAGGYMGGGDAKLMAAAALWIEWQSLAAFALTAALAGAVLGVSLWLFRSFPLPVFLAQQGWVMRLHDKDEGIPYAVALCAGALLVFPETRWIALAV